MLTETNLTEETETAKQTEQTEIGQLNDEDIDNLCLAFVLFTSFAQTQSGCFGCSYQNIEAKITFFFCSRVINLSFNGLTYNTRETEGISIFLNTLTKKIEANCKITFFRSGIINLVFDGLAYNTSGHFAHCSYFSSPLRGSENYYVTRKMSARIIC